VNCKLLGLHFEACNPFSLEMNFKNCQLDLSSFTDCDLSNTNFQDCNLQEVDFTNAKLENASFETCNLSRAIFNNTDLRKADFRTAIHFQIDPASNRMEKAKFSHDGLPGLLSRYNIVVE